ncbi:DNA-binding transcriptional LysR family regulator [Sphingomonas zeicaulis]|uniref:LysR family transcriptional regulator n=1 Tax=Sphingomonas zeicaulis TaxID=1632740 RepID=UPI003D1F0934
MLPDLEAWAIFARVAEAGSFAGAAAQTGLSTATVSKAVARLERRLGERLIHRTSRRLALTETGRVLVVRAQRILAEGEAAEAEASAASPIPQGLVRLAAPMSFGLAHVAPALPALFARHPLIRIDLRLDDRMIDPIAEGVDIVLRIGRLADSSLVARRLSDVRLLLVGAPRYFVDHGMPARPADLAQHRCLIYANLPPVWHFTDAAGHGEEVRVEGPLIANNADAFDSALEAGLGLSLHPDFMIGDRLARGVLVEAMPGWQGPHSALHLLTPPGGPRPARVQAVVDHLVAQLGGWSARRAGATGAA